MGRRCPIGFVDINPVKIIKGAAIKAMAKRDFCELENSEKDTSSLGLAVLDFW
jgi:hypothetical protein